MPLKAIIIVKVPLSGLFDSAFVEELFELSAARV